MADGARCFYAYYFCGELVKTARAADDVNSIGSALPSLGFSPPLPLCLYGCVVFPFHFCLLASSMMSCRHPYSWSPLSAPSRIHAPVIRLSCGFASSAYRFVFRSVSRIVSLRFVIRPVPRVGRRGDVGCHAVGVCELLFSCQCDVVSGRWRGVLLASWYRRCQ